MLYRTMQPFQQGWKNEKVVLKGWGPWFVAAALCFVRIKKFCLGSLKPQMVPRWALDKRALEGSTKHVVAGVPKSKTFTLISVQISLEFGAK